MKSTTAIRLGVNIDHIATLRQVRGGTTAYPDLLHFVKEIKKAKGDQITIHLREDQRHIQLQDLVHLSKNSPLPINLEMAMTDQMFKNALKYKPTWVCYVPEKRQELTTEGGLDVLRHKNKLKKQIQALHKNNILVSLFIAPDPAQIEASAEVGADAIELHTGHWVLWTGKKKSEEWERLYHAGKLGQQLGLRVHAGHGLDYQHTRWIKKLPHLVEVNIGHFLVCEALKNGLQSSIRQMKKILK